MEVKESFFFSSRFQGAQRGGAERQLPGVSPGVSGAGEQPHLQWPGQFYHHHHQLH